ncbi:phospholipase D-like domain-containing protein [Stutzerimonas azotifigens]|uniref:phospholipase D-like domain-containing protein n=1 Tax=Stutzerimonas azotifigens TaxID=291995 RepID=UPI0004118945|nr:phosphatidylserine/phosphatidylglycerophosphate/cardiolipin synthase family protein [Stutzerimonas azotifigens]
MKLAGPVYPWRSGNRFRLLVDGPQYFPVMTDAVRAARQRVDIELYLVEDGYCADHMVEVLSDAARRGVQVRCLLDGFGCLNLSDGKRDLLKEAGVELRIYNPLSWRLRFRNLHRDHRKILLVDGRVCFVGGTGVTDQFWNPQEKDGAFWHEAMVEIQGPVLQDWQELFEAQWMNCLQRRIWQLPLPQRAPNIPPTPWGERGMGRVAYAAARQHGDVLRSLVLSVAQARRRVWLTTPYFLPSRKLRRMLIRAARRGVDVRLVLTGRNTDHPPVRYAGQRFYPRLLRSPIRIYEYQPHFSHLKMVLVDDWVSIGSCNFDHWNLRWNLEANLEALDPEFCSQVVDCFERDMALSERVDLRSWKSRPLAERVKQFFWGRLDRLVMGFFNRNG